MSPWVWVAIVGTVFATAGAGVFGYFGWKRAVRRFALTLIGRREAVFAVQKALEDVATHLAQATDDQILAFVEDPDSLDRRALQEVAMRARIAVDELDTVPLPRSLIHAAESLADAAFVVAEEAAGAGECALGADAFDALACLNLERVRAAYDRAQAAVVAACAPLGIDETAVYGGGMYI